jgi:hypothetical protein
VQVFQVGEQRLPDEVVFGLTCVLSHLVELAFDLGFELDGHGNLAEIRVRRVGWNVNVSVAKFRLRIPPSKPVQVLF